jgi:hypothetical protein
VKHAQKSEILHLVKQASIGSALAKAIVGGPSVGKGALMGGLLGGLANAAVRGRELSSIAARGGSSVANATAAANKAKALSGGRIANNATAKMVRDTNAATRIRSILGTSVNPNRPDLLSLKGLRDYGRAFGPDLARSFASGAASGGAVGAGGAAALKALRRRALAKKIDKAAPMVLAGGAGLAALSALGD